MLIHFYSIVSRISLIHPFLLMLHHLHNFFRTSIHRLAELFVDPMINTGEERERFKELVQNVGDTLTYMEKVQHIDGPGNYEDVSTDSDAVCNTFFYGQAKAYHN